MDSLVPTSYEAWRHCITEICKIPLTADYIRQRIAALHDTSDYMTQSFVRLYGERQRQLTVAWFQKALLELGPLPEK